MAGTFNGSIVRLISDIRAKHGTEAVKLGDCGRFVLAEDLSDLSDIIHIDLSHIGSLEGDIMVFKHTQGLQNLNMAGCENLTGDIKVFKHTRHLKILNTYVCRELTGDIKVFEHTKGLQDLNMAGCERMFGDKEAIKYSFPQCDFTF